MKASPKDRPAEPEDQRDGRCLNSFCHAGKAINITLLALYAVTIFIFLILLIYKLRKYRVLRRVINFYMYIGLLGVLSMRIASNVYLMKYDDLNNNIEVLCNSFFLI